MARKSVENQSVARRKPLQERSQLKIELILEAATRIIDKDGLEGLTTNRVAEDAGISIGTLYQYFGNKEDVLEMLVQREMQLVTDQLIKHMSDPEWEGAQNPARALINTIFGTFGGRSRVHRVLLENALARGAGKRLDATPNLIAHLLTSSGIPGRDGQPIRLSPAQAFVLTQAFVGVFRATLGDQSPGIPRPEIEDALLQMIECFVGESLTSPGAAPAAQ